MKNPIEYLYGRCKDKKALGYIFFTAEHQINSVELLNRVINMGMFFKHVGINDKSRVIIKGDNSVSFIVAFYAGWYCNAIVSPLADSTSKEKIQERVEQFKADFVIDLKLNKILTIKTKQTHAITLNDSLNTTTENISIPEVDVDKGALCLFTSGSTGEPKGVLLSMKALYYGAKNVIEAFRLSCNDIAFCVLPLTHVNGLVTTLLSPLYSNSRVVFFQGNFYENLEQVMDTIQNYGCTWMSAIPMHYALMNTFTTASDYKLKLRFCRSAAAPLPKKVLNTFYKKYSIPIIETLGMTETAGQIFTNPLPPQKAKPGSVGLPFHYKAKIVDGAGKAIQGGDVGEVFVKGNAMMLSYLDDPDSTNRVLSNGWLKTGDLARKDEDGFYYIEGRTKNIVIFAGLNISLGYLEKMIAEEKLIKAAVCLPRKHRLFGEVVEIIIEPEIAMAKSDSDYFSLRNKIKELLTPHLPSVQAIGGIHIVKNIPKTPVGKIDKNVLLDDYVK